MNNIYQGPVDVLLNTRCEHNYSCLATGRCGDREMCKVDRVCEDMLILSDQKSAKCAHRTTFGDHQVCVCPTRYALHKGGKKESDALHACFVASAKTHAIDASPRAVSEAQYAFFVASAKARAIDAAARANLEKLPNGIGGSTPEWESTVASAKVNAATAFERAIQSSRAAALNRIEEIRASNEAVRASAVATCAHSAAILTRSVATKAITLSAGPTAHTGPPSVV